MSFKPVGIVSRKYSESRAAEFRRNHKIRGKREAIRSPRHDKGEGGGGGENSSGRSGHFFAEAIDSPGGSSGGHRESQLLVTCWQSPCQLRRPRDSFLSYPCGAIPVGTFRVTNERSRLWDRFMVQLSRKSDKAHVAFCFALSTPRNPSPRRSHDLSLRRISSECSREMENALLRFMKITHEVGIVKAFEVAKLVIFSCKFAEDPRRCMF